jgi:dihydropteroate synthase
MIKSKDTVFEKKYSLSCQGRIIDLSTPKVMGIINLTPDSFYDGGKIKSDKDLLAQTEKHLKHNADFLDLGAFSSRPGAQSITEDEEIKRLDESVFKIKKEFPKASLSIDTYRSKVADQVLKQGASFINDISAGADPDIFTVCSQHNAPIVLMHHFKDAFNQAELLDTKSVISDVINFLEPRIENAYKAGVKDVVIDPGFGFGKELDANYTLLKELKTLRMLNCPILIGLSRKRMVYETLNTEASKALNGTSALHMLSLLNGGHILRAHDVQEAKEVVDLYLAYQQ